MGPSRAPYSSRWHRTSLTSRTRSCGRIPTSWPSAFRNPPRASLVSGVRPPVLLPIFSRCLPQITGRQREKIGRRTGGLTPDTRDARGGLRNAEGQEVGIRPHDRVRDVSDVLCHLELYGAREGPIPQ